MYRVIKKQARSTRAVQEKQNIYKQTSQNPAHAVAKNSARLLMNRYSIQNIKQRKSSRMQTVIDAQPGSACRPMIGMQMQPFNTT
jgi:hypothetical protein